MTSGKLQVFSTYFSDQQLCERWDCSKSTLDRRRKAGLIPQPEKFHPNGRNYTSESTVVAVESAAAARGTSTQKSELGHRLATWRAQARAQAAAAPGCNPEPLDVAPGAESGPVAPVAQLDETRSRRTGRRAGVVSGASQ
jgi:hypothetical protein